MVRERRANVVVVPDCLFCRIAAGDAPAHVVLDEPDVVAFLDVRPVFDGHTLVVPRRHTDTLLDVTADELRVLFEVVQRVAAAVVEGLGAQGSWVSVNNVVSQSVPHLHVHVVPRTKGDGLRGFFWPRHRYASDDVAADVATRLRAALGVS
jgi:histidine triad (HIT) family protein